MCDSIQGFRFYISGPIVVVVNMEAMKDRPEANMHVKFCAYIIYSGSHTNNYAYVLKVATKQFMM